DPRGGAHHLGFHRVALRELGCLVERPVLAEAEQLGKALRHAPLAEVEPALEHHRHRQDGQADEEPEHPARAQQREGQEALLDHRASPGSNAPTALATRSAASWTASRCWMAVASLWNSALWASETSTCVAVPASNCARTSCSFSRANTSVCSAWARSARADSRSRRARRSSSSIRNVWLCSWSRASRVRLSASFSAT